MPTPRESELSEALDRAARELTRVSGEFEQLRCENKLLREKIDALLQRLFGAQSEKLDAAQLLLMLQGLDAPGKAPEPVAGSPVDLLPLVPYAATSAEAPPRRRKGIGRLVGGRAALDGSIASA